MQDRKFYRPVDWLLGRQLLGSIKGILLYTAYGKKLDPRDWMEPHVFPSSEKPATLKFWREEIQRQSNRGQKMTGGPQKTLPVNDEQFWHEKKEFWFDYMADTGDGMKATYSIAYLSLSNLYLESCGSVKTRDAKSGDKLLPRGQFLFIGGDTAYHTSDYMTLANRVQRPFKWAYQDVKKDTGAPPYRRLFGIPGNHDYYDQLDGFRRQFRRPIRDESTQALSEENHDTPEPQLAIPGLIRGQCSSYVALSLPFDWWLWGLDTEVGQVDPRQRKFFRDLCQPAGDSESMIPPKKLILATCAPTTVFGKLADPNDGKAVDAIAQLGLSQPFLPDHRSDGTYDLDSTGDPKMLPGQCRLDVSGDVHHYERYWGPKSIAQEESRQNGEFNAPSADSYASVVSGAGGAFHHPSATFVGEVREQVLYPSERESTHAVAQRIFRFWNILRGGSVHIAGFALAFIITFADQVPQSSRGMISSVLGYVWESGKYLIACVIPGTDLNLRIWHWTTGDALIIAEIVFFALSSFLLFAASFSKAFFSLDALGLGTKMQPSKMENTRHGTEVRIQSKDSESKDSKKRSRSDVWLWIITISSGVMAFRELFTISSDDATHFPPFASSVMVLISVAWATGGITLSLRYSEFLFDKCHDHYIKRTDWILPWPLCIFSILFFAAGLWRFGKNTQPAFLVSDAILILAVLGIFSGLLVLPLKFGGELFHRNSPFIRLAGKLFVGFWHAILQLVVPFLLIQRGTVFTLVVAVALLYGFAVAGECLLRRRSGHLLLLLWLICGISMFTLTTFDTSAAIPRWLVLSAPNIKWIDLHGVGPALFAGTVGSAMSCVWFGWYLAVCFAFNGHNNEVGGAARIEEFKQFIRFSLTETGLTGYVIAVDHPQESQHRDRLCPKIVDVIKLKVKDNSAKQTGSH